MNTMQIACIALCCFALTAFAADTEHHKHHAHHGKHGKHHHKHGHHGKHHKHHKQVAPAEVKKASVPAVPAKAAPAVVKAKAPVAKVAAVQVAAKAVGDEKLVAKMKELEARLAKKKVAMVDGHLLVNGPVPADFSARFAQAVAQATGAEAKNVEVTNTKKMEDGVVAVDFKASPKIVAAVNKQSADPDSKLANGNMHSFLVSDDADDDAAPAKAAPKSRKASEDADDDAAPAPKRRKASGASPVEQKGIDIDTAMPYGELEPFGREDTAQELTEDSVSESNEMVDQLERAEVAEEKRSVFRALTRLRGAAITSFDGVARSQTGNIDEYNKIHQWRTTHPLHHLADEESDVSKWAFPDNADF